MKKYVIILAAGTGSRLYPLTLEFPKSLVKVNGKEILSYQIDGYLKAGIKEENIYIVTGYKHQMVVEYLNKKYPMVNKIYNVNYCSTNNMFSLYLSLKEIIKNDFDYLFINNADCLYDIDLMFEFINSKFDNAIAVDVGRYIDESMKVIVRNDLSLVNIAKNILEKESYGVSIDLYKFERKTINKLYEIIKDYINVKKDLKQWTEVAFPELFKTEKIYPFDIKSKKWVEVDNNEDLALADKIFSKFDIKNKKVFICDMDGTIYVGSTPIQGAVKWINDNPQYEYYFLTNNSSKIPSEYVIKLQKMGINCSEKNILTPLFPLIEYLKEKKYNSIYVLANNRVMEFLKQNLPDICFEYNELKNEAVVLTYDTEIDYQKLKNISILLNDNNIEYLATHTDVFCPTEKGPIPDIGSFIGLIEAITHKIPNKIFGKPSIETLKNILKKYSNDEIVVVGDRLYTDKVLADNIGCDFICVLSGETTRLDVQKYNGKFPTIVSKILSI